MVKLICMIRCVESVMRYQETEGSAQRGRTQQWHNR